MNITDTIKRLRELVLMNLKHKRSTEIKEVLDALEDAIEVMKFYSDEQRTVLATYYQNKHTGEVSSIASEEPFKARDFLKRWGIE